jgi:hypothetical protein
MQLGMMLWNAVLRRSAPESSEYVRDIGDCAVVRHGGTLLLAVQWGGATPGQGGQGGKEKSLNFHSECGRSGSIDRRVICVSDDGDVDQRGGPKERQ